LCLVEGKVLPADVVDFVDEWHKNPGGLPLYRYLGMNKAEYSLWARNADALEYITEARREEKPDRETAG
jgi:hypothetical protein